MAHIFLNDTGVTLLQRHCFRQAFHTLNDAMVAIRDDYRYNRDSSFEIKLNNIIGRASRRPIESAIERLVHPEQFSNATSLEFTALSMEDLTATEDLDSLLKKLRGSETIIAIRLDTGSIANMKLTDICRSVHAAIIMYNYGIAHQAYATVMWEIQRPLAHIHFEGATKLLILSDSVLERLSKLTSSLEDSTAHELHRPFLFVQFFVLLSLHGQVVGTGHEGTVQQKIAHIRAKISVVNHLMQIARESCISAPAA